MDGPNTFFRRYIKGLDNAFQRKGFVIFAVFLQGLVGKFQGMEMISFSVGSNCFPVNLLRFFVNLVDRRNGSRRSSRRGGGSLWRAASAGGKGSRYHKGGQNNGFHRNSFIYYENENETSIINV